MLCRHKYLQYFWAIRDDVKSSTKPGAVGGVQCKGKDWFDMELIPEYVMHRNQATPNFSSISCK
jgi:hypothetical protein